MEKFCSAAVLNFSWFVRVVATIILIVPVVIIWSVGTAWYDLIDTCEDTL